VERARFAHADALGQHLGVEPLDGQRLAAGARAAMSAARRRDGHQYLTRVQCTQEAAALLKVDVLAAGRGVEIAEAEGALVHERVTTPDGVVDALYTPRGLDAERDLAADIARLAAAHSRLRPFADAVETSDDLTAGQAEAVRLVFAHPVTVLTGGPGTGKTRTIAEVVDAAEAVGLSVAVCAPTGRAAKRIEELVGHPASTVHRLLEARPVAGGTGFAFRFGRGERLPFDLVVCDEVSMADTSLAAHLVAAIEDGAHLLFVGDPDQLPPVGPGDVLRDLLRSGVVPHVTLTEIHRQAAESRIVALANAINGGHVWDLAGSDGDLFHAESPRRGIVARVVEAVANRAPEFLGVEAEQVQVVAPIYRGDAGVDALNVALKEALNPAAGRPDVNGFHEHDRVMQTRNDPELDVSNGDVGRVVDVDASKRELRVLFPRGEVTYDVMAVRDLVPAWAVTVHKSQGGEWPVVVFVVDSSHRAMLWRNLAYTAVTRAQRALITVGQAAALQAAARHDVPRNRQTLLAQRLADLAGSAPTTTEVSA
jgi:exodeoxyribonuclease V alpha subunit